MPISAGTLLGPYEVLAKIGEGGMGEVYRARDTRLDRIVAIKVSSEQFTERFEREARVVAALNHPHICQLYDVGPNYLVMEYIEGAPLQGPMPVEGALKYAGQICEALDAAHQKGIVHRDLKPANILLTRQGIKLLDFGLAKLPDRPALDNQTVTRAITAQGQIVGTLQYMSPEQLQGPAADGRSDIFAFGAVLYELLTGRRAFDGANAASVITSIMSAEPQALPAHVPPMLDRIVKTCLAKDPAERFQTARDLKRALEWSAASAQTVVPAPPRATARTWPGWAVATLLAMGLAALGLVHFREKPPEDRMVKFTVPAPQRAGFGYVALSPDGRQIAFLGRDSDGNARLWLRSLDSLSPRPLAGTEGALYSFWSPDSRFIAFFSGRELKKIEANGGVAQTICEMGEAQGGTWGPDGTILVSRNLDSVYRVNATGGTIQKFTELDLSRKESRHYWPSILPDGKHFLYTVTSPLPDVHGIWIASTSNPREKRRLLPYPSQAQYADGYVLYVRDGNLMAQPIDPNSLELRGESIPIVDRVSHSPTVGWADFSSSQTGAIAIGTSTLDRRFTWFDRSGKSLGVLGAPGRYQNNSLSPDQSRVAADAGLGGGYQLFVIDLNRGATTQLTFGASTGNFPMWSPDGARIAFASNRDGVYNLYMMSSAGSNEELLLKNERNKFLMDWSRDGRYLLYGDQDSKTRSSDLWVLPMTGERKPAPCIQGEFDKRDASFSPDGRWIAYWLNQPGTPQVYVQSFPAGAGKWQISTDGGTRPRWRDDGRELYYLDRGGRMMAVDVKASQSGIEASVPKLLFETGEVNFLVHFDVMRGGQRFLMPVPDGGTQTPPVTMILNWTAGLRK